MAQKDRFYSPAGEFKELQMLLLKEKTQPLFSQRFLCLSRACLGKMIHFIYQWHRKKWRVSHRIDRGFLAWIHPLVLLCYANQKPPSRSVSSHPNAMKIDPLPRQARDKTTQRNASKRGNEEETRPRGYDLAHARTRPREEVEIRMKYLLAGDLHKLPKKNVSFEEFFPCLSQACLGKKIAFICKWLKKRRFSHLKSPFSSIPASSRPCSLMK
jgi:hypothetical protein